MRRADGCCVAMDTSAEENQSGGIDSSGEEEEEEGDVTEGLGFRTSVPTVHPEAYRCRTPFYSFTKASHHLMVSSIMAGRYATAAEVVEADPSFVEAMGRDKARRVAGIEGRWKVFQDRLHAQVDGCGNRQLFFKTTPEKLVSHMGQWQEIVHTFHVDAQNRHFGVSGTIERTRQVWITDTRRHGIPELFVQEYIAVCAVCNPHPTTTEKGASNQPFYAEGKRTRPPKFTFPVQLEVPVKVLSQKLESLAIEHKVVLRVLHSNRVAACPFLSEVVSYICHRGQFKRLREKRERSALEKRRCRASFRCGCNFRIKTHIPITNYFSETGSYDYQGEGTAIVLLNPMHVGHEPGTEADILHLPVHPSAIRGCEEDRNGMKDIHAITRSSLRQSPLLKAQASELEQATFRFFLTKKETQRLLFYQKSKEKLLEDIAWDMHSKHYEADAAMMKVDIPQGRLSDIKDKLSSTLGVLNSQSACMPARRLGFQKVLARLADARQASAANQPRAGHREAEASIYYSRHKSGGSGRHTARRNHGTQTKWFKESEFSERCGRDSSRLDLVNKGISQFNRLHLTENMEADDDVAKQLEEARHATSQTLDGLEKEFKKQVEDLRCHQMMGCAIGDINCTRDTWTFPGGIEQINSSAVTKRCSFDRLVRLHYVSTQPSHQTSESARVGATFLDGGIGGQASLPLAQALTPHYGARTRRTVGRKRKRNSVFVQNLSVIKSPNSDSSCLD